MRELIWLPESVDTSGDRGQYSDVKADVLNPNYIYTCHYERTSGSVAFKLSTDGGVSWNDRVSIDSTGDVGKYCSLAFSGQAIPRIWVAYYDLTNTRLKIARSDDYGTTWTVSIVDGGIGNNVGKWAVVKGHATDAFIAYYDATNTQLKFIRSSDYGITWGVPVIVDTIGNVGEYISMAVYEIDAVTAGIRISYYDATPGAEGLKYAYSNLNGDLGSWATATVESGTQLGKHTSIASALYAGFRYDVISYAGANGGYLKLAYSTNNFALGVIRTIDSKLIGIGDTYLSPINELEFIIVYTATGIPSRIKYALTDNLFVNSKIDFVDPDITSQGVMSEHRMGVASPGLSKIYVTYYDETSALNFKVAQSKDFVFAPLIVNNIVGVNALDAPNSWVGVKDGSVGDYLEKGLIGISPYYYDPESDTFIRMRGGIGSGLYVRNIDYVHDKVHRKLHFTASDYAMGILVAAPKYWLIIAPPAEFQTHLIVSVAASAGCVVEFFEDPTITATGTFIDERCNNRTTPVVIVTFNPSCFYDPTVTADGTRLFVQKLGGNFLFSRIAGFGRQNVEWVLGYDQNYIVKVTPDADGLAASVAFEWYLYLEGLNMP